MLQKIALMMILRKAYYKIMDILAPNYFLNHWVEDGIHHLEAVDYPDFEIVKDRLIFVRGALSGQAVTLSTPDPVIAQMAAEDIENNVGLLVGNSVLGA